ncbi:hypothetical protein SPRG_17710 [Saprolegnia parasitica CBS 223.65]|uniref:Uncharacterized protein n=1 Tax=Saprolegnia parasitica (strain CBS 223.65) TaxID=695850 RepID=A0A067BJ95_SAPPC|nr:hypothetical protein SPRG_17710 [Saprolegnia parasitica CBS 223.65]KDO16800.1 hypothetical protein SPRG_17710 [Saprolegnia parasitica CBS 223.65]|eukprot:XP_012212491.1 hypothetical protein SPRG_17710 [Saprolegnia parasitica CBS 223.65]
MQTLDKVVMDQVGFVVDGLDHVSHFTDLNVREVFAREFDVLATAQQQLLGAIEVARRSRGQFKKDILAKLEKRTSKDLRELQSQLLGVWNYKDEPNAVNAHDKCAMLYQIIQRTTLEVLLTKVTDTILVAMAEVSRDNNNVEHVDETKEELRLELTQLRKSTDMIAKQMEAMAKQMEAMMAQQGDMATQQGAILSLLSTTESRSDGLSPSASMRRMTRL